MRKVGTGITVRTKPEMVPAAADAMIAYFRSIQSKAHETWGGYADVVEFARRRLAEIKSAAPSIHEDLDGYNASFVERNSEGWYINSVVIEADIAESAVEQGRPWQAVACAMRIGELLTEARMKLLWEGPAVVGQKILSARAQSRDEANDRRHRDRTIAWARWNAKAAEIWKKHPDWGAPAVAGRVKEELNLDERPDTIRKRLKKAGTAG